MAAARSRASEREANALSVRTELQADCYAVVWGYYANQRGLLEGGDAEEGLRGLERGNIDACNTFAAGTERPPAPAHLRPPHLRTVAPSHHPARSK